MKWEAAAWSVRNDWRRRSIWCSRPGCSTSGHCRRQKSFALRKSYTVETVTKFFPREAYLEFTAMSERALVYSPEQYSHRTLDHVRGRRHARGHRGRHDELLVRSLLSEGRIEYTVTVRDNDGGFTTKTIVKEGPTNIDLHDDQDEGTPRTKRASCPLGTDDSRERDRPSVARAGRRGTRRRRPRRVEELQQLAGCAEH